MVGLSILTSINRSLELLCHDPASSKASSPTEREVMERLQALAPSSSLKAYFSGRLHREDRDSQRAALELQDNYILLQTCVKKAIRLADEMRELASITTQDHLALSLSHINEHHNMEEPNHEPQNMEEVGEPEAQVPKREAPARSDDEILLMMSALASALIVESKEVMGQIASSINLETSTEDMFAYLQMWKLAPFLDEGLSSELVLLLGGGSQ